MPQPSTIDVVTPFDPTGYSTISGAQLEQFAGGIAPYSDKGFVVITTDTAGSPNVPAANTTTKWQNYIWLRISSTYVTAYVWNPMVTRMLHI
jgi:hypothetical protein